MRHPPLFYLPLLLALLLPPAHALTDLQGKPAEISDYTGKGKWTVFEVWASDCAYCPDAVFYMKELQTQHPQVDLYGISLDGDAGKQAGQQAARGFIRQHNITFPNLLSRTLELDNYLHVQGRGSLFGTPSVLVYNPKGELRGVEAGAVIAQDIIHFIEADTTRHD